MSPQIVLFDMDGTIVCYKSGRFQSSWDAVGHAAGKKEEWDRLLDHYYPFCRDAATYREWFDKNCEALAGIPVAPILEKIFPPPYTLGFLECCASLQERGVKTGLVSSGLGLVAERIKQEAGLDFILANDLYILDGKFTGTGKLNIDFGRKGEIIKRVLEEYQCPKEGAVFVGDHENDIPAWKEVGLPLGMNIKDERCFPYVRKNFADFHQLRDYLQKYFLKLSP